MTSRPFNPGLPEVGGSRVVSILIVVVLPAPLGPSRPKTSPFFHRQVQGIHGREFAEVP